FSSIYLRYFLLSLFVLLLIFLSGISSRNLENGYILSVWGNEIPSFESIFFKLYLSFIFLVLFIIVFPIAFAHHIHNITTTNYANIYLSRCITRVELLIGTLLAFYSFFLVLTFLFVLIIMIYFWVITETIILYMLIVSIPFLFLFLSSFTFLSALIITINSIGNAALLYVIYIFLVNGLFINDVSSNLLINIFSFIVPPISQTLENIEQGYLINIIRSMTSLVLSLFVSAFIYQRKEFYN
ncbi:MAG: hypothetical protein AB1394_13775, partial [Bacteroidota bacterium]